MKFVVIITQKTSEGQYINASYLKSSETEAMSMYHAEMAAGYTAVASGTLEFETVAIISEFGAFILSDSTLKHTQIPTPEGE